MPVEPEPINATVVLLDTGMNANSEHPNEPESLPQSVGGGLKSTAMVRKPASFKDLLIVTEQGGHFSNKSKKTTETINISL